MDKRRIRLEAFNFLGNYNRNIRTKFNNICGKTGQYNVPDELFQKRTNRKNRVLISWKAVNTNKLTLEQLKTFTGGVAVEFINEDYFLQENWQNPLFLELVNRIGSNDTVSAIISIRSESGSSSSAVQREYFAKLINNTTVNYRGTQVTLTANNYKDYAITQLESGGTGNEKWNGFLFVSIKGGQQDTIETHSTNQTIFNPACEYASEDVCFDLDLVMSYFALTSIDKESLGTRLGNYLELMTKLSDLLNSIEYDFASYTGNLYDYVANHPSTQLVPGELYDPIQVEKISIEDFAITNKEDRRNLDFTHDEAVNLERFYWDNKKNCILSPARPTNVFWSKHLSNMMQQDFSLIEYFEHEKEITTRRERMLAYAKELPTSRLGGEQ